MPQSGCKNEKSEAKIVQRSEWTVTHPKHQSRGSIVQVCVYSERSRTWAIMKWEKIGFWRQIAVQFEKCQIEGGSSHAGRRN
jgi:hypothetical protein